MTTTKSLGASPHTTTNADIVISYMGGVGGKNDVTERLQQ